MLNLISDIDGDESYEYRGVSFSLTKESIQDAMEYQGTDLKIVKKNRKFFC
jgi:hypothetical protein